MFIILGIVILVLSLVVALISLIREQSKDDRQLDEPNVLGKEPPISQTVRQSDKSNVKSAGDASISPHTSVIVDLPVEKPRGQVVQEPSLVEGLESKSEGVFPWEDTNQKTIEQIKADLAKIAIEKGSAKARQGATGPTPPQPRTTSPVQPEEVKPWPNDDSRAIGAQVDSSASKNLTGEISLRNIPRRD